MDDHGLPCHAPQTSGLPTPQGPLPALPPPPPPEHPPGALHHPTLHNGPIPCYTAFQHNELLYATQDCHYSHYASLHLTSPHLTSRCFTSLKHSRHYATLHCSMLSYTAFHHSVLCYTLQRTAAQPLRFTTLCTMHKLECLSKSTPLALLSQQYNVLHCHCIALCYTALHHSTLHCTASTFSAERRFCTTSSDISTVGKTCSLS